MSREKTPLWQRMIAPQNVASVLVGLIGFVLLIQLADTTLGVVVAAVVAAIASGLVWLGWRFAKGPVAAARSLGSAHLGTIRSGDLDAPTLVDPVSAESAAYRDLVSAIESETNGQVLLVSPASPSGFPSPVALNLAVAATQLGRRAVLIDGDLDGGGLSRYSSTGRDEGLADIALGEASLADASQVWSVGDESLLPVVTAGTLATDGEVPLDGVDLAAAFDELGERADLIFVDAPPIADHESTVRLAAHADGSILVVDDSTTSTMLAGSRDDLSAAGAPVIGFILNEPKGAWAGSPWLRTLKRSGAAFLLIAAFYALFTGVQVWASWNSVARQSLDTEAARAIASPIPTAPPEMEESDEDPIGDVVMGNPAPEEGYSSFLLIGTDEAAGIADVILLTVLPAEGEPFIVSLPRDLYLPNRCTSGYSRLNATLHGCGDINGPTFLTLAVEDFTGITVDHFALFDFEGFSDIVDAVGGVEICVAYDRRDRRAHLELEAGCTVADGPTTLAWVRSRQPVEFRDGAWRAVPGASDLLRNSHQQDVVLQLIAKLKSFDSPADLAAKVDGLTEAFTLDDRLGIGEAIALAWSLRDLDLATVNRLEVPVVYWTTDQGQSVLRATAPFDEVIAEFYPDLFGAGEGA